LVFWANELDKEYQVTIKEFAHIFLKKIREERIIIIKARLKLDAGNAGNRAKNGLLFHLSELITILTLLRRTNLAIH